LTREREREAKKIGAKKAPSTKNKKLALCAAAGRETREENAGRALSRWQREKI
jgi:hypothetical protein